MSMLNYHVVGNTSNLSDNCYICLDSLNNGDKVIEHDKTESGHTHEVHEKCKKLWLEHNPHSNRCGLCKKAINVSSVISGNEKIVSSDETGSNFLPGYCKWLLQTSVCVSTIFFIHMLKYEAPISDKIVGPIGIGALYFVMGLAVSPILLVYKNL